MSVKQHYEKHLADFYGWMLGDFESGVHAQMKVFQSFNIKPSSGRSVAIDLGAGNGLHSIALARIGFQVKAIDFSKKLLTELSARKGDLPIAVHNSEILSYLRNATTKADIMVCMGDTLPHFQSHDEISELALLIFSLLKPNGKLFLSFRDYSAEAEGTKRFIPVKSDETRILTCMLEYQATQVTVHDLFHEKNGDGWHLKVSAYRKLRLSPTLVLELLRASGFTVDRVRQENGMALIAATKGY